MSLLHHLCEWMNVVDYFAHQIDDLTSNFRCPLFQVLAVDFWSVRQTLTLYYPVAHKICLFQERVG